MGRPRKNLFRRKDTGEIGEGTPKSVAAALQIADKNDRLLALTRILSEGSGAEVVAASRELRANEKESANNAHEGSPPPTTRMEQTARLVRMMIAVGPGVCEDARELIRKRKERMRNTALAREGFLPGVLKNKWAKEEVEDGTEQGVDGAGDRESDAADGQDAVAADSQMPELPGAEDVAGEAAGEA
jgi:hypothetical protein